MQAFIRGIGQISPQPTFENEHFLEEIREYSTPMLKSIEPNYKDFIKPIQLRRMSRLLKMGVTAAGICLQDAGMQAPDAIITGTGLGMMEDTEKFLTSVLDNNEQLLNPTSFIQSTHNTVGAHIAVMLNCNKYNLTYVHGPLSFENALLDSLMMLDERKAENILLGGVEEITDMHFRITDSASFWKEGEINNLRLLEYHSEGTIAGEGAAFFLLTRRNDPGNYAVIRDLQTIYKPSGTGEIESMVKSMLGKHGLVKDDISLVLAGFNGDQPNDDIYRVIRADIMNKSSWGYFKHLCGEHYLASAFGFWLAIKILKTQRIPEVILLPESKIPFKPIRNILIYNHYKNIHHSLMLLSSC